MSTDLITQDVLKEIRERHLTPKPRWGFRLRQTAVWTSVAAMAVIGSVATTTVLFLLAETDWDIFERLDRGLAGHILLSLPYVWLAILAAAVVGVIATVRRTRRGYRFRTAVLIAVGAAAVIVIGLIFTSVGFDSEVHEFFRDRLPLYARLTPDKDTIWNHPEKGLLAGEVTGIGGGGFILRDLNGQQWLVAVDSGRTVQKKGAELTVGSKIKLIGETASGFRFEADDIRPWGK